MSVLFFNPSPRLVLDFDLLVYAFGQIPLVVVTWICMFLSVLVVPYILFHLWSQTQSGSYSHSGLCSFLFASIYLLYQVFGLGFLPTYIVVTNSLPPASCFIVIMEQVRDCITINILFHLRKRIVYLSAELMKVLRLSHYFSDLRSAWWWKPTPLSGRMYQGSWCGLKRKRVWKIILSKLIVCSLRLSGYPVFSCNCVFLKLITSSVSSRL